VVLYFEFGPSRHPVSLFFLCLLPTSKLTLRI